MIRMALIAVAVVVAATPMAARADPATHALKIASQDIMGDCAGTNCTPICVLKAELASISPQPSPELRLRFFFLGHPGLDLGVETAFSFDFRAMGPRATGTSRDDVMGMRCKEVRVRRIEATHVGLASLVKIDFRGLAAPLVAAQPIFADPERTSFPERGR